MKKPRTRYHHGDLRASAIDVARRMLDEDGADGLTLDRIAARAGVTTPALYRHFANREALLKAVIWEEFQKFVAHVDGCLATETEPGAILQAIGRAYVQFAMQHPGWFRLQFSQLGIAQDVPHAEARPQYPGAMTTAIAALIDDDDPARIQTYYVMLWSLAHGLAALSIEGALGHVSSDDERLTIVEGVLAEFARTLAAGAAVTTARAPSPTASRRRASRRPPT